MVRAKNRTCCFTGHRILPDAQIETIKKRLEHEIEHLIQQGVLYFGCGGALGFNTLAAQAVLRFRTLYPQIKLILVLPCRGQESSWKEQDKSIYNQIKMQANKVVFTSEDYYTGCMFKRNRRLVDESGWCICYLSHRGGGTAYTVSYALKKGLQIINLFKNTK